MIDNKKIEDGVKLILEGLNINNKEVLENTPKRISKMYNEFLNKNNNNNYTTFKINNTNNILIDINNIKFISICEHHLLPYFGFIDITYIPKDEVLGLSKFNRIIEKHAKGLTLQERMTINIANELLKYSKYVKVVSRAKHTCVLIRTGNMTYNVMTYEVGSK